MIDDRLSALASSLALCICEGGFERTVLDMLLEHNLLLFDKERTIAITSTRNARRVELEYLGIDYGDETLTIVRMLDSRIENFRLSSLYRDRYPVLDICTCPEIEILTIINENAWEAYSKASSKVKPSAFCKQVLKLPKIKNPEFLKAYWTIDDLVRCICEYKKLHRFRRDELSLFDILR